MYLEQAYRMVVQSKEEAADLQWLQKAIAQEGSQREALQYTAFYNNAIYAANGFVAHKITQNPYGFNGLFKINEGKALKPGKATYLAQKYDGPSPYPDVDMVFPKHFILDATIDLKALYGIVAELANLYTVTISFTEDWKIKIVGGELPKDSIGIKWGVEQWLTLSYPVESKQEFSYNPKLLVNALSMPVSGNVTMRFHSPTSPMVIDGITHQAIIMPMHTGRI